MKRLYLFVTELVANAAKLGAAAAAVLPSSVLRVLRLSADNMPAALDSFATISAGFFGFLGLVLLLRRELIKHREKKHASVS